MHVGMNNRPILGPILDSGDSIPIS